jgi:hypothetical protein
MQELELRALLEELLFYILGRSVKSRINRIDTTKKEKGVCQIQPALYMYENSPTYHNVLHSPMRDKVLLTPDLPIRTLFCIALYSYE